MDLVANRLGTTYVIQQLKARNHSARHHSSIQWTVSLLLILLILVYKPENDIDFCLWAPIDPNSLVGNVEGEMVAWCTKPGRGTRLIPKDSLQGVQFMKTPDYVQVVGFVNQQRIFLDPTDFGGEMDPHGADLVRAYSCTFLLSPLKHIS